MEDNDIKEVLTETPWTSIDLYYKGFHIKKSVPANFSADRIIEIIDEYIEKGYEPSWNQETNKGHDPIAKATQGQGKLYACKTCGADAEYKEGVSKTGKTWKAIFCKEVKEHVEWLH